MDDNSIIMKIFNYLWVVIALMPFFGGLGFIFAGWRVDETKWMDEGIIYMIPFIFLSIAILNMYIIYLAIIIWFIGIIRAVLILRPYTEKLRLKQNLKEEERNNHISESNYKLNQFLSKPENMISNSEAEKFSNTANSSDKSFDKLNIKSIDINSASYEELLNLPSFNSELAEKVIVLRSCGEYINSLEDLSKKLNLSSSQIEKLDSIIVFNKTKKEDKSGRKLDL